ncbi:MAG TPA: PQQ-binding-like beta-propeller repeat protein [Polyangiaceae bacterium]|nr:PQQ-binding-like beta-propeller repeat protein [Polyangiaceae bacterium]
MRVWGSIGLVLGAPLLLAGADGQHSELQERGQRPRHEHRQRVSDDPNDWPQYNHDDRGSRFNSAEHLLRPRSVGELAIQWQYAAAGPVNATPAVVNGRVYAGDATGLFHAVTDEGAPVWTAQLDGGVLSSALVTNRFVFVGTGLGNFYALGVDDGAVAWQVRPDSHPVASIQGSPLLVANKVIVPMTTDEAFAAADPAYPCCTGRGSVAAFDPDTGALLWQKYTISDADAANGSAGAGVWGTPTYDAETGVLYFGSGQNYVPPATSTSDSVFAVDVETGETLWQTQVTENDVWNFRLPPVGENKDGDFGDSPKLFRLRGGRKAIGIGQKTGTFWVFDAETGEPIASRELVPGGVLGGFQTGCAYANGLHFTNGVDWPDLFVDPANFRPPPTGGAVIALSAGLSREVWRFETPGSPFISGVTVAGGVVYAVSSALGTLYALRASDGRELAQVQLGPTVSGPSVSRGRVYVGTGNLIIRSLPTNAVGTITALGVP